MIRSTEVGYLVRYPGLNCDVVGVALRDDLKNVPKDKRSQMT